MSAAAPFRLLDDFQAGYIKFNGREPRTLEELLIAKADYEHRRRRAEIKAIAKKLALLDVFLPALAERGVRLCYRDIVGHDSGKSLRIYSPVMGADNKMFEAMVALGFKEIERKDTFRDEQTVTLKHGRALVVLVDVKKASAPAPAVVEVSGGAS
jgi:hypothetical protein